MSDSNRKYLLRIKKILAAYFEGRGCSHRVESRGDELVQLEQTGHIVFVGAPDGEPAPGRRKPAAAVAVVYVAGSSKYTTGAGLENLSGMVPPADETLFLLPPDQIEKSHVVNKVAELNARGRGRFSAHPYSHFIVETLRHCETPAYAIVPPEEAEKMLRMERIGLGDLPLAKASDAPLVWVGARPGDVVLQTSNSPTAVESVRYLRVV